ncbi:hypothetical protein DENSPDRAFT_887005 [Dentipellis sp. KUC8613]|nr:hypothetical protein DENSPDRAFT_887005 [Dentipellis sp. KUC8613]
MSRPPLVPPSWAPSWCRPMLPRVAVAAPRSHLPSLLHHAPWLHRAPIPPQRGILRPRTPPPTTRVSVPCFRRRPTHARCLLAYASRPHPAVPREHADIMRTRGRRFVSVRCRLKPPLSSPRSCCFMPVCHDLPTPPHLCFLALSRIPAAVLTCTSLSRPLVFALPRALAAVCPPLHFSSRAPFTHTRALHTPSLPSTPRRRSPHLIFIGRNQQERTDYASPVSRARAPRAVCSSDPAAAVCPPRHAPVAPQHCAALLLYHFAPQQQHRTPAAASRPHHVPATLSAAPLTSRHFVHTLAVLRAPEMTQEVPLRTLPPSNGVWRRPHTPLCHIAPPDPQPPLLLPPLLPLLPPLPLPPLPLPPLLDHRPPAAARFCAAAHPPHRLHVRTPPLHAIPTAATRPRRLLLCSRVHTPAVARPLICTCARHHRLHRHIPSSRRLRLHMRTAAGPFPRARQRRCPCARDRHSPLQPGPCPPALYRH